MIEPVKFLSTTLQEESTRIETRLFSRMLSMTEFVLNTTFKADTQLNALIRVEQLTSYIICLVIL